MRPINNTRDQLRPNAFSLKTRRFDCKALFSKGREEMMMPTGLSGLIVSGVFSFRFSAIAMSDLCIHRAVCVLNDALPATYNN
jgi:hypothetical protein